MNTDYSNTQQKLLTLQEAAQQLNVTAEVLLRWNGYHILTPKITLTGEISYTQEQINQFLDIQHTLQIRNSPEPAHLVYPQPTQSFQQNIASKTPAHFSWRLLLLGSAALLVAVFTQQGKLTSLLHGYELAAQTQTIQTKHSTSTAQVSEPVAINQAPQLTDTNADNNLHQLTGGILTKNIFAENIIKPKKTPATNTMQILAYSDTQNAVPLLPQAGLSNTTTLASVAQRKNPSDDNQTIDTNGDIVGNAGKPNTMATILGAGSPVTDYDQSSSSNPSADLALLFTGTLAATYLLFSRKKTQVALAPAIAPQQPFASSETALEVNQRMDGTVVLSFQGKDYKISKPELDSDSDKFIERLMQLMQPGMKEMEYETLSDAVRLNTPLSRIVTRLGFVGVKRDLFFPRTSKHAVLFRKYVTYGDLISMNLSLADIQRDLSLVS